MDDPDRAFALLVMVLFAGLVGGLTGVYAAVLGILLAYGARFWPRRGA